MDILVPQHISKYACVSACLCLFPNCGITYVYGYTNLSLLFGVLFITSILHWHKVRHGLISKIDKSVALMTMYQLTFVDRVRLHPTYQTYWFYVVGIMGTSFMFNELAFVSVKHMKSVERERACYYSVGRHIMFIHVLPTVTYGTFIILSDKN